MRITEADLRAANAAGLRHAARGESGPVWCYYSGDLQAAYDAGRWCSVDLSGAPVVTGYRYGALPESGKSHNHAAARDEIGVSLAQMDGEAEISSVIWFCDRARVAVTGILAGRGSDGEALVIVIGRDNLDREG